ncbi:MAG: hypothetical protein AAGU18_10645 [Proteiniphilum sp.]
MSETVNPIMALNPFTGKLVNVEPLFRFIQSHDDGRDLVDEVIRHLIINDDNNETAYLFDHFNSKSGMFLYLYDLRDLFKEISECQISMPKKDIRL